MGRVEEGIGKKMRSWVLDPKTEDMESAVNFDRKSASWSGPSLNERSRQRQGGIRLVGILLVASLCFGIYFNSLNNNFVNWDDPGLILKNNRIRSLDWKNIEEIFTPKKSSTFQPIRVLSYAIDYRIWKLNPLGYHITNILFYLLTCVMVFLTLRLLSAHLRKGEGSDSHFRVGLFGALLFAALPVHVEAVAWLAARKEVLQGFFFFTAFYVYLRSKEEEGRKRMVLLGLVLLAFLLAILSKASAVVFPAVLLIYEISVRGDKWVDFLRSHWLFFILSILISLIFVSILIKVMFDSGGVKALRGGSFLNNFLLSFYVFMNNIKLLIFTVNYSASYAMKVPAPMLGLPIFLATADTLLLLGLSLWSLKKTKVVFFAVFFFLITLLPYLNIIPISTFLADRYLFIASFSYCLLLGVGFDKFYALAAKRSSKEFFKVLSTAVFLFLLAGYSFMTVYQNTIWENSYTLWTDAVEKQPESNTANALMGVVYMELGMDKKAVAYLEKAVQVVPDDDQARNNLGIVYGRLDQPEKALDELVTALRLNPDSKSIKINLALFFLRQKEYRKSEEILKSLLSRDPQDANLHYRLGEVYKEMGDYKAVISAFTRCVELAPQAISLYEELGNIYLHQFNDVEKAKYYYTKGIESVPQPASKVEALRRIVRDLESR